MKFIVDMHNWYRTSPIYSLYLVASSVWGSALVFGVFGSLPYLGQLAIYALGQILIEIANFTVKSIYDKVQ